MDHLAIPKNPAGPLLQIPYICDRQYRGGPFLDYPERHGVSMHHFAETRSSELTHEKRKGFIQEWFFFGVLHEMYGEFSISDDDFISTRDDGIRILNTSQLNGLARRWIRKKSVTCQACAWITHERMPLQGLMGNVLDAAR